MRIVFVGAVQFSDHCLKQVIAGSGDVVGVITLQAEDARFNSDYANLSGTAAASGIPVFFTKNINDQATVNLIRSLEPEVIFVFGWSQMIGEQLLELPELGCIGSHPALLPENRGRHPLIWALVDGMKQSGLTFFYMDEGADSGDILWQDQFEITIADTASSLYRKMEYLSSEAIAEFLPQLIRGDAPRTPQDASRATYRRKRGQKDGEINWASSSMQTYNLIRALSSPYIGAHTLVRGVEMKIWRADIPENRRGGGATPGTVFSVSETCLRVSTGDGELSITGFDLPAGVNISRGDVLGVQG